VQVYSDYLSSGLAARGDMDVHVLTAVEGLKSTQERQTSAGVTVHEVPAAGDLDGSLTAMRRQMIRAGSADVAVIIGGRTTEGDMHRPGVEEELTFAREAHIPSVVLASPGGQAAVIAARGRHDDPPWTNLGNGLSDELNSEIADGDDYADIARILWDRFGAMSS